MNGRLVRLTGLVVVALSASLGLGVLLAGAWPSSVAPAGAPTPSGARHSVQGAAQGAAQGAGATPSGATRALRSSPSIDSRTVQATGPTTRVRASSTRSTDATRPNAALAIAADVEITLCAKTGTKTMPDGVDVAIWGFALKPATLPCSDPSVVAELPGPLLEANDGNSVEITLDNGLAEDVTLAFPGQALLPDDVGASPGGTKTYTFTVDRPGTFLYEAGGPNAPRQVAMGLYGALLVRSATAGRAYDTAASAYDREAVLVLSEIDPALNANPTGFPLNDYAPKYWLIAGEAYDEADPAAIDVLAGERVLLRYVNASLSHHTLALLGLYQRVIAKDAYTALAPFDLVSETFPTGTTGDMIVSIPNGAAAGTRFPLFSRQLYVTNVADYPGGMLTFLTVVAP